MDNVCYDSAAHYQRFQLAEQCGRSIVILREEVRGQHAGRAKVGIVVECHVLPRASTTLLASTRKLSHRSHISYDSVCGFST